MKRLMTSVSVWLCVLALVGCGADGRPRDEGGSFDGKTGMGQDGDSAGLTSGGSGAADESGTANGDSRKDGESAASAGDRDEVTCKFRIVDGAESGNLILAGESCYAVYTLSVQNERVPIYLDGQQADSSALKDGMMIEVVFDGTVQETFPCQMGQVYGVYSYSLGTEQNPGGGYYDLCGLYLQVLNDLWDKDAGLNGGVSYIGVDLSDAPGGLTDGEKEAIAWIFGCAHQAQPLTMSYEELAQQGYLTEVDNAGGSKLYQWEEGILFTITASGEEGAGTYSLSVLNFDAKKWRSPMGAYYLMDCQAVWPEMGTWEDYKVGGEAIS